MNRFVSEIEILTAARVLEPERVEAVEVALKGDGETALSGFDQSLAEAVAEHSKHLPGGKQLLEQVLRLMK